MPLNPGNASIGTTISPTASGSTTLLGALGSGTYYLECLEIEVPYLVITAAGSASMMLTVTQGANTLMSALIVGIATAANQTVTPGNPSRTYPLRAQCSGAAIVLNYTFSGLNAVAHQINANVSGNTQPVGPV